MRVKDIVYEDFLQYKKPSMFIICPYCSFKCDMENGTQLCQNWPLAKQPNIEINNEKIISNYLQNSITKSIVFGGLETLDSFQEVYDLISLLRKYCDDDVVIYTGYNEDEVAEKVEKLKEFKNIIIKYGRYIPNQSSHYDEVLGIELASNNQYAKRIS